MSVRRILLIAAIFLVEALLVHFLLAQRFPLSGDDYSYLYQAKLFASGKLSAEDPIYNPSLPFYGCIETYCLRDYQGHRFSKYPPGRATCFTAFWVPTARASFSPDPICASLNPAPVRDPFPRPGICGN